MAETTWTNDSITFISSGKSFLHTATHRILEMHANKQTKISLPLVSNTKQDFTATVEYFFLGILPSRMMLSTWILKENLTAWWEVKMKAGRDLTVGEISKYISFCKLTVSIET